MYDSGRTVGETPTITNDRSKVEAACSTPVIANSQMPLGMRAVNVKRDPLPSSSLGSTSTPRKTERLRKPFIPPSRTRPSDNVNVASFHGVKSEPFDHLDVQEKIESFDENGTPDDVKPDLALIDVKPNIDKVEVKRKRSVTPEVKDTKPLVRGSRDSPITVGDDDEIDRGRIMQIPRQLANPPPPIINNIIYNITYNIINVIQAPPNQAAHHHPMEAAPPPAYAPLPGLEEAGPTGLPGAQVNNPDPDIIFAPPIPRADPIAPPLDQVETTPDIPVLSKAQQRILQTVLEGKSVLIHGSAGTGKSVLIRAIKQAFEKRYNAQYPDEAKVDSTDGDAAGRARARGDFSRFNMMAEDRVRHPLPEKKWKLRVTASTGLAAVNIGGTTFHSFIGARLCKGNIEDNVAMIRQTNAFDEWTSTATLIIDEISMVDGHFFDKIDQIGQIIRGNNRPFGGLQVTACGDFLQLPPVGERDDSGSQIVTYTFDSHVWTRLFARPHQYNLKHNFRQGDVDFRMILERMRRGYLGPNDHAVLKTLTREPVGDIGIKPVHLMPSRKEVDNVNQEKLRLCEGPTRTYLAQDMPGTDALGVRLSRKEAIKRLNEETRFPEQLNLRVGAQVMLIMNMKEPFLVNGTTGCVTGYMTRDEAQVAGIPEPSLVAFFDPPRNVKYPVIRFAQMRYCRPSPPAAMLVAAMDIKIETSRQITIATRTQIPMILAWALTIHKAQGQTLDRVKVDLKKCSFPGQAYTAISRATSKEGLQLTNYSAKSAKADRVAMRWVRDLEGDDDNESYAEQPEDY